MIIKQLVLTLVPKMICAVPGRGLGVSFGELTQCCCRSGEGCPSSAVNFLEVLLHVAGLAKAARAAQAAWAA